MPPDEEADGFVVQADGRALDALSDDELASLGRTGDRVAVGVLFARYRVAAERFARHLGMGDDAPDVVAESVAQILELLSRGKGPNRAFRAYLYTAVRHESRRRAVARKRLMLTGDVTDLDAPTSLGGGALDPLDIDAIWAAFKRLPKRWRSVLIALEIEGLTPREFGARTGMKPNAVSALAYRARGGLRESYLAHHAGVDRAENDRCGAVRKAMAKTVLGTASPRTRGLVASHLAICALCAATFAELHDLRHELGV